MLGVEGLQNQRSMYRTLRYARDALLGHDTAWDV